MSRHDQDENHTPEEGGISDEEPLVQEVLFGRRCTEIIALRLRDGLNVRLTHNKWEEGNPFWVSPARWRLPTTLVRGREDIDAKISSFIRLSAPSLSGRDAVFGSIIPSPPLLVDGVPQEVSLQFTVRFVLDNSN